MLFHLHWRLDQAYQADEPPSLSFPRDDALVYNVIFFLVGDNLVVWVFSDKDFPFDLLTRGTVL